MEEKKRDEGSNKSASLLEKLLERNTLNRRLHWTTIASEKALLALSDPKPMRISRPVMTAKRAKQLFSRTNRTLGIYRSN